jgi:hypothetical protein
VTLAAFGSLAIARWAATRRVDLVRLDGDGRRLAALTLSPDELRELGRLALEALAQLDQPLGAGG